MDHKLAREATEAGTMMEATVAVMQLAVVIVSTSANAIKSTMTNVIRQTVASIPAIIVTEAVEIIGITQEIDIAVMAVASLMEALVATITTVGLLTDLVEAITAEVEMMKRWLQTIRCSTMNC